jgi:hypothetical protein
VTVETIIVICDGFTHPRQVGSRHARDKTATVAVYRWMRQDIREDGRPGAWRADYRPFSRRSRRTTLAVLPHSRPETRPCKLCGASFVPTQDELDRVAARGESHITIGQLTALRFGSNW